MKVLEFIKEHENWEELLAQEPYFIKTVRDGHYFLLRYNQLASDFTNEIVRECRGAIFYEAPTKEVKPVCVPFYKFGNYGESYVPEIDWASASVKEKVDGSLMKVWRHNGEWHISTNNTIDARKAESQVEGRSFYDVFMTALENAGDPHDFFNSLDPHLVYMFELVSPETRVTIAYPETKIYYLSARDMTTLKEVSYFPQIDLAFFEMPKTYPLQSLTECIDVAAKMGANEEGFVVCDKYFNRVKVKSMEYLLASKVRNNNVITVKRIVEAMRAGIIDDFYAYAPDYQDYVDSVLNAYADIAKDLEATWQHLVKHLSPLESKKDLAMAIRDFPKVERGFCFMMYDHGGLYNAHTFLEQLPRSTIVELIKEKLETNNE